MKILIAILLVLFMSLPAHAEQTLSFAYIDAPLSYSSLQVLKAAYAKLGIRAKGLKLPSARALAQSDAGITDGETHRIKAIEDQHPQLFRIDVAINAVEGLALSCNKPIDTTSLDAIRAYHIGIKTGTRYAERMTEGMPFVTSLPDERQLMKMLLAERLDIVIGDRPWAEAQRETSGRKCLRINEPPLVVIPLYHYLHKRHADLVPEIARVLQQMKDSGEMKAVRQKALASVRNRRIP